MSTDASFAHGFLQPKGDRLIRLPEVHYLTALGKSTIHKWVAELRFPAPIKIGKHFSAWRESEVLAWIEARSSEGERRAGGSSAAPPAPPSVTSVLKSRE